LEKFLQELYKEDRKETARNPNQGTGRRVSLQQQQK
jgi:hypothetical protein